MFGTEDTITQVFPDYFLDYREKSDGNRWSDRVVSNLGEWSGNIFDFFFKIAERLCADVKRPFMMRNYLEREDDTSVHKAIREALANALIHADYYGRQGVVVEKSKTEIKIANPGGCRPDIPIIKEGGVSDPRNPIIFRLFAMIDIGERAGSGVFNIYTVWKEAGWAEPSLSEEHNPERVSVVLPIDVEKQSEGSEKSEESSKKSEESSEKSEEGSEKSEESSEKSEEGSEKSSEKIRKMIRDNPYVTIEELSELLNITTRAVEKNLSNLKNKGQIKRIGSNKGGYWKTIEQTI
jgi:predicted HTH transcriptional regulator